MAKEIFAFTRRITSSFSRITAAIVVNAVVATAASATTLTSALLISSDADKLECLVSNVGSRTLEVTSVSVRNVNGTFLSVEENTCTNVDPGRTCVFSAGILGQGRGTIEFQGAAKNVRGQCQLTSATNQILATTDLR
jgi:hypothetical protein